jgi:hypothetical protein
VARAAGGVDQPHFPVAEFVDRRGQGAIEDEFFDELGRLQQRKFFLRCFGKILVEVAEKTGIPVGISEVMDQRASVRIDPLPEADNGHAAVAGDFQAKQGIVPFVEQRTQGRQSTHLTEDSQQVFAVAVAGMLAEVAFVPVLRQRAAFGVGGSQAGAIDQRIVFKKTDENAHQQPMHGGPG